MSIVVTDVLPGDLELIDTTMLAADRTELDALTEMSSLEMLRYSVDVSLQAYSMRAGDDLLAVYGLAGNLGADVGCPWLVAGLPVLGHRMGFLRATRHHLSDLLGVFPLLENWVWWGNHRALRWLGWLGFQMEHPQPYGRWGLPFARFTMEDPTCAG